jgi:hypothetical protein
MASSSQAIFTQNGHKYNGLLCSRCGPREPGYPHSLSGPLQGAGNMLEHARHVRENSEDGVTSPCSNVVSSMSHGGQLRWVSRSALEAALGTS